MPPNGSATSSPPDTSPAATLTSAASPTCGPTILPDTPNAISSPASEGGRSPFVSPDGPMTDLFGQAHVPASLSAPPVRARRPMTNATCGLAGFLSSPSGALQSSLESRLRRQLVGVGSILFSLTWKAKATPAGRPYCQLAASGLRISDSDCGSWGTPTVQDAKHSTLSPSEQARDPNILRNQVYTASWPTPMAGTPAQRGYNEAGNTDSSRKTVELCGWVSPTACSPNSLRGNGQHPDKRKAGGHAVNLQDQVLLASWATPTTRDHKDGASTLENTPINGLLGRQVSLASWGTPRVTNNGNHGSPKRATDGRARLEDQVHGAISTGSPAPTEKSGQLNPAHSRWLMGYPAAWDACAPTATRSSRKSRPSSSKPLLATDTEIANG